MPEPRSEGWPADAFAGDAGRAFSQLYSEYHPTLVAMCRRLIGGYGDAEAVAHEAFVRAWLAYDSFAPDRPFWPWLSTIARRLCINECTNAARRNAILRTRASALVPMAESFEDDIEDHVDCRAVRRALGALAPKHRRLIHLRDIEGRSYEQIARMETTTVESVRASLRRARVALRATYGRASEGRLVVGGLVGDLLRRGGRRARVWAEGVVRFPANLGAGELAAAAVMAFVLPTVAGPPVMAATAGPAPPVVAALPSAVLAQSGSATVEQGSLADRGARPPATWAAAAPVVEAPVRPEGNLTLAASPSYDEDHTVYAAGAGGDGCPTGAASCALYKSTDGGASWQLLSGRGRLPGPILLPAGHPTDRRIFSLSSGALQVSDDDGATFRTLVPAAGSVALSPLLSHGDPRVLLGGAVPGGVPLPATEYDLERGTLRTLGLDLPVTAVAMSFSFAADYAESRTLLVSGVRLRPLLYGLPTIWRCVETRCDEVAAMDDALVPTLARRGDVVVAHTRYTGMRVSLDGGKSFREVRRPVDSSSSAITDVAVGPNGRFYASVQSPGFSGGIFASDDAGESWRRLGGRTPARAVTSVLALPDGRVLAASVQGLLCSVDGGATFADRCAR